MGRLAGTHGKWLFAGAGLAASALFLWLAVRKADLAAVGKELDGADLGLVFAAIAVLALSYGFQATRWRRIASTPSLGLTRFYGMVLGGLAANNVLPIRIGELLRARWLGQDAPMPGGRALGTVALDRACDVVALALLLAIGIQTVAGPSWLLQLVVGVVIALVVVGATLLFARIYTASRGRGRRARGRARRIVRDTLEVLAEPIGRRRAATLLGLSICTWMLGALAVALVARSVGIEVSPAEAAFVTAALNLGVAVPSSPGYVGTYQWLGVASLGLLDVPVNEALAFTILMQASWYVPTTVVGGTYVGARLIRRHGGEATLVGTVPDSPASS